MVGFLDRIFGGRIMTTQGTLHAHRGKIGEGKEVLKRLAKKLHIDLVILNKKVATTDVIIQYKATGTKEDVTGFKRLLAIDPHFINVEFQERNKR